MNIIICDDEQLIIDGLTLLFKNNEDIKVLRSFTNGIDLQEYFTNGGEHPDILLLDLKMEPISGVDICKRLVNEYKDLKIMILSTYFNPSFVSYMVRLGVHAFLPKDSPFEELKKALYVLNESGVYFTPELIQSLQNSKLNSRAIPVFCEKDALTRREEEIVEMICEEYTTSEIADKLFLSEKTVGNHRNRILSKLGAKNTVGIVIYAMLNNLVSEEKILGYSGNVPV